MNRKFFVSTILGLFALILLYFQPYKLVVVVGNSMYPTLKNGQILLAKKIDKIEKAPIMDPYRNLYIKCDRKYRKW